MEYFEVCLTEMKSPNQVIKFEKCSSIKEQGQVVHKPDGKQSFQ